MTVKKEMTEKDLELRVKRQADIQKAQPKEKVKLFLNPEEKRRIDTLKAQGKEIEYPAHLVIYNGVNYQIPRGIEVEVPKGVAEILRSSDVM